jgi:hypothetical protein
MMFKFLKIIGIGYLLSVSTLANATLIDNGDYTTDTESGLDWLDWTKTWDYTQSEALDEFGGAGWRIATATEANGLIDNQFGGSADEEYLLLHGNANQSNFVNYAQNYNPFFEFLGDTVILRSGTDSYATIEGVGLYGAGPNSLFRGYDPHGWGGVDRRHSLAGVALVKVATVSEPAFIALFALGLVGIGFARRRQS